MYIETPYISNHTSHMYIETRYISNQTSPMYIETLYIGNHMGPLYIEVSNTLIGKTDTLYDCVWIMRFKNSCLTL